MFTVAHKVTSQEGAGVIEYVGGKAVELAANTATDVDISTGLTGGIASGASSGDMIIVACNCCNTSVVYLTIQDSGLNNYTVIHEAGNTTSIFDHTFRLAYKFSNGDTIVKIGASGASSRCAQMTVKVFRGVDSSTPLDVTKATSSSTTTILANPPAITPITSGAFICCAAGGVHNDALSESYTSSDLVDMLYANTNYGLGDDGLVGFAHKEDWTSGQFDPAAWTYSSGDTTDYGYIAVTFALRPA